ncbi:MAG: radical SAM protein [bacterium]|nr:radical SAM protein [bacterium]
MSRPSVIRRLQTPLTRWKYKIKMPLKYWNYAHKKVRPSSYPNRLYVESTNQCNLKCIMCPNGLGLMKREKGFMEFDLFKSIIDEMSPHVEATTVHIWGEPLLHPRILEMIDYASSRGVEVEMSTNAVLLNKTTANELVNSGLQVIYLCLDGTKKETYEKIRQEATFEETKANIESFVALKREKRERGYNYLSLNIQIIEMDSTRTEIDSFVKKWSLPGVDHINVKAFDSWGSQVDGICGLESQKRKLPPERFHCPNLWYHAHIYWDGTLVCCDRDFEAKYPLGNVSGGVMKVWNGDRMAGLRQKHITGNLDDVSSCRDCIEWSWWRPAWFKSRGNAPEE